MKIIIILLSAFAIISCKEKEKSSETSLGNAINSMQSLNKIGNETDEINKRTEELLKAPLISNEEFKAAIPETLLGLPRKEIALGEAKMMSINNATAKYSDGGEIEVNISITDGAGEMGSSIYTLTKLALIADVEKQTENGWKKSMTISGNKCLVEEDKSYDVLNSKITFIAKDRYIISLESRGLSAEELKKAIGELNLNSLK
ncbi:MAG: hypothetical protein Q4G16_11770 [Cruoricaptor ignavus]|nr:hypothetical protein [Cruoricaptor ignavus]